MNNLNKKGAMTIGMFVVVFMGIIVALSLFNPIADTTGDMTTIRTATLANYTTAAVNGTVTLQGRENTTVITVVNASNVSDVWTTNFGVTTKNTAGVLAILLKTTDAAGEADQNLSLASVTYSYKPQGYSDGSGARGIINIILIFAAITIMAFAYGPVREAFGNIVN